MQRQKKNSLNGIFRPLLAQKKRKGRTARRTLRLESLESRQMLSTVPWMPNHGDPDHTAADAGNGPEASAYVARDLQQGGDAPAARDSVTIINPDSMGPTPNPFRGCIPTDPCQMASGVIQGQTIEKSLEHGPDMITNLPKVDVPDAAMGPVGLFGPQGIDGESTDDPNASQQLRPTGGSTDIWTDGPISGVIAKPQIGSEHWPPWSVHDSVQLGVNNLWHDAIPEEDELGISFPDWLGPPGITDPQCQGACYVVGGEPASQLRSEIWTDGPITSASDFAAQTGVGDEPRDFSPDKKVAEGKPEDTDGLIAIIAFNGETQGKDRVTPEDIKGNATDEDHKDWVITPEDADGLIAIIAFNGETQAKDCVTLEDIRGNAMNDIFCPDDIKGGSTDTDGLIAIIAFNGETQGKDRVTPDDIDGEATDKDHKGIVMLGDIKGEATDKDHKGIVML